LLLPAREQFERRSSLVARRWSLVARFSTAYLRARLCNPRNKCGMTNRRFVEVFRSRVRYSTKKSKLKKQKLLLRKLRLTKKRH